MPSKPTSTQQPRAQAHQGKLVPAIELIKEAEAKPKSP